MSRAKKMAEKMLRAINFEPAPMSTNKGRRVPTCSPITKKDRRHSGHKIIFCDDDNYPIQYDAYNSWSDYRDGMRDKASMRKNIYIQISYYNDELYYNLMKINKKNRKHEKIRKARKIKNFIKNEDVVNEEKRE